MISLLSTVQALPDAARVEVERALVPYARRAAVGALAADIAHDAGNALFGLAGLLGLLVDDAPVDADRRRLLQQGAGDLERALTPLLQFARGPDDDGARAELGAVAAAALDLYRHGERKLLTIEEGPPPAPVRVEAPPSLVLQAVVHLLLACHPVASVRVDHGAVHVAPAREHGLDELVAARIADDRGGSLTREAGALVLRLPAASP